MSMKSTRKTTETRQRSSPVRTRDGEQAKRIRALRASLEVTGTRFAEMLSASRTQVSVWENGTEKPNKDKLIKMAELAPTEDAKLWFLKEAGVDEQVRALLREIDRDAVVKPSLDSAFKVALAKDIRLAPSGALYIEKEGEMFLPSTMISAGSSAFCMKIPKWVGLHPGGIQWFFSPGDYVVIEQTPTNLDALENSLVAVYFERMPRTRRLSQEEAEVFALHYQGVTHSEEEERRRAEEDRVNRINNPVDKAESDKKNDELWTSIEERADRPGVMYGWLRVQTPGNISIASFDGWPFQIALETFPSWSGNTGQAFELSDWIKGTGPSSPRIATHIRRDVHIAGRVVGWFKNRSASATIGPPD
jgi:DNA-binding transcriptional regulator YiaG